jgi:hypothetical protein
MELTQRNAFITVANEEHRLQPTNEYSAYGAENQRGKQPTFHWIGQFIDKEEYQQR